MKPKEQKLRFAVLRADGKPFSSICKELGIAKGTCSEWEKEMASTIRELENEALAELYETVAITRRARIKKLGETLAKMEAALEEVDYTSVPPDKLLNMALQLSDRLMDLKKPIEEYREPMLDWIRDIDNEPPLRLWTKIVMKLNVFLQGF